MIRVIFFACLLLLMFVSSRARAQDGTGRVTVRPKRSSKVLLNPGKGWVIYGTPSQHPPEVLDMGNLGYRRFHWCQLEPQEGQFNWKPLDDIITEWASAGKQFAFGVMTASSHSDKDNPFVTPEWVFKAGATYRAVETKDLKHAYSGVPGRDIVPDFKHPVFLKKFGNFLKAFGARYDGNPHIAFIDIRSYGNWGEGHLYPWGGEYLSPDEYKKQIQMHMDVFKKTRLCLSCDNASGKYIELYDWAIRQGVAPRRDGICGNSNGSETARGFGYAPGVFEFFGSYEFIKEQGWWDGKKTPNGSGYTLDECVKNGKPSYISLSQWAPNAETFLAAERSYIERMANRMGYHLVLEQATFSTALAIGESMELELVWQNEGVAPVYVPCQVAVALLNDKDEVADIQYPSACNPAQWMPGETITENAKVSFSHAVPAEYRLAVGLVHHVGDTQPAFGLGIEMDCVNDWYILGKVTLAE